MRRKCNILAICSFMIALAIYLFTYYLYHHLGADGTFSTAYHETATKPFITLLFAVWGVIHQFAAVTSWLVGRIFFSNP